MTDTDTAQKAIEYAQAILRREEGLSVIPYKCSLGHWTIGFGTVIDWPDVVAILEANDHSEASRAQFMLSKEIACALLARRVTALQKAMAASESYFAGLSPERQAILISMAYQLGYSGFNRFTRTRDFLRRSDFAGAAAEMLNSTWARQTPARAQRHADAIEKNDVSYWIPGGQTQ